MSKPPTNETATAANPVNITYTYCHIYNGTSYLTGVIKNVGMQNLVNVRLRAEGYANNITVEQGVAGPQTGVDSVLLPGENTPFMINMSKVASIGATANLTRTTSASSKPMTTTRNVSSNRSTAQVGVQIASACNVRYKITPEYELSKTEPAALVIINNKTRVSSQTTSVSGEIYNAGTKNVSSSLAAAAFYRNDGYVLGMFVSIPQEELAPNKTAAFQINIPRHFFDSSNSSQNAPRLSLYTYELTS